MLFNGRIQTRVLQAIGRCTRSLEDYSAVFISNDDLVTYFADPQKREFLHPELQAEIDFGVDQSKGVQFDDFVDNFNIFLDNDAEWEDANRQIVAGRSTKAQKAFPAMDHLANAVAGEIDFQKALWASNFEGAFDCARRVLGELTASDLRGYRCLWHYLAGSAASLAADAGITELAALARSEFSGARDAAGGIPWLASLARLQANDGETDSDDIALSEQIERVELVLTELGTVHDRRFTEREKQILEGLRSTEHTAFERAHETLGELLGFISGNEETDGSPDPWWVAGSVCLVFEDHAGARDDSALGVNKARQASCHADWMRANIEVSKGTNILPVLVTPVKKVRRGALAHLQNVALWPLDEFREWARNAVSVVREVRRTFVEPGNLVWRASAAETFERKGLDATGLYAILRSRRAADRLSCV